MTTNAVNYQKTVMDNQVKKAIADLDRELNFKKLGLQRDELEEAIRHNKVDEYLKKKNIEKEYDFKIADTIRGLFNPLSGLVEVANDESWHNKLKEAYDEATKLPFNEYAGNPTNLKSCRSNNYSTYLQKSGHADKMDVVHVNSGIIHIRYVPTVGTIEEVAETSELQNNVRLLWKPVRGANSGAINGYDQSDLFQFTMASSSVFEILRLLARPLNYIYAKRKAMNVLSAWDVHVLSVMTGSVANANWIVENYPDIVQTINSFIRSYNSNALPIGFDLTRRRSLLNGRIFCHEGNRDEMYIFSPTCYYVYDEANAKLISKQLNLQTFFSSTSSMKSIMNEMLSPLVNGTATATMAGDMKRAFPKQVGILRELTYKFKGDIYSNDEHILEALRNGVMHPSLEGYGAQFDIKQGVTANLDTFIYQGQLDASNIAYLDSSPTTSSTFNDFNNSLNTRLPGIGFDYKPRLLDVKKDKVEPYDIMAGTRFMTTEDWGCYYDSDNEIVTFERLRQWGSEVLTTVECYYFPTPYNFANNLLTKVNLSWNYYMYSEFNAYKLYERFHYLPQGYNVLTLIDGMFIPGEAVPTSDPYDSYQVIDAIHSVYNVRLMQIKEIGSLHRASFGSLISIVDNNNNKELE